MDVSIITPTFDRPKLLWLCCRQVREQITSLKWEHIVISDGPDIRAQRIAERHGAKYLQVPRRENSFGAFARDAGLDAAQGRYVCFWDDDDWYAGNALQTLYDAAQGFDVGVCQMLHGDPPGSVVPQRWRGTFEHGDVGAPCCCIKTEVAKRAKWGHEDEQKPGTDFRYFARLQATRITTRFVPKVVAEHVFV
ncbi:MAG TPA: glycosyltransferase family 2 protein [Planctomycetaceae bacterium]|jgi:glycosyltransferase involved in cell wall biosynthesis